MLSLVDLQIRIRSGALTPEGAIDLAREAVAAREGEVGAFAHLPDAPAPAATSGPLAGIPIGVKDIIDTADMPTAMGSPIYEGWRPRADAPVVATLRRAGGTILGKTTTTAFASSDPTATRNPAAPGCTPGGSSAGSAAGVSAGMVALALGTQTAGSVIRPGSYCGVAAMKPSFRSIPTQGVKCYAWTLDTVGFFAAGIRDLAAAFEILTGRPGTEGGIAAPRIAIVRQEMVEAAEPEGEQALEAAIRAVSEAGAVVGDLVLPEIVAQGFASQHVIQDFEGAASLGWEYDHHRDRLAPLIRAHADRGRAIEVAAYDKARRAANAARREMKAVFGGVDAILTYAAPGPAPRGLGATGDPRFNRLWTLVGTPCISVPGLRAASGAPIGVQVVAPFARDARALDVALFVEAALARRAG